MSTPKECGLLGRCFYAECHCKPAPVRATEPDAISAVIKEFTTRDVKKVFDEPDSVFSYAHSITVDFAAMASTIHTLRARLAEAERVTEEQVERNRVEIMDRDAFITFEEATAKARTALTAARGGG